MQRQFMQRQFNGVETNKIMGISVSGFPSLYRAFLSCLLLIFTANLAVASQPAPRIKGDLDETSRFALTGNVRPAVADAQDRGSVSGSTKMPRMTIHFAMTASQNADLLQLLRLQQTRHSNQFHQWLTPEQFADRFGMNSKDIEKVTAWLESIGFYNVEAARSRNLISFDGTAGQAETAFHTSIHGYVLNGVTHIANATDPELPKALNGMVTGIRGLHDFHPKPHGAHPHFTSSTSGVINLVPNDFATIYDLQPLYTVGITGTGRSIAIPGQTDIALGDIEAFETAAGLPIKDPQVILTGTDPGSSPADEQESDLDLEWAGGLATGASIIFVNSTDVFTSVTYAITNSIADVLPITYGQCEVDTGSAEIDSMNTVFMQASAEGMTVIAASGDDGAADCDQGSTTNPPTIATQGLAVDFPGSSAYVTSVGGTEFNEGTGTGNPSCVLPPGTVITACLTYWNGTNNAYGGSAKSYIPEIAWNDTSTVNYLDASGGGISTYNAKASWQTGTGVPSGTFRSVPDVSLDVSPQHEGLIYCTLGSCVPPNGFLYQPGGNLSLTGGTSASSPSLGAIVALLDQETGNRQGLINPNLYALASVSTDAFHDITTGNNILPCQGGSPNCSSSVSGVPGTLGYTAGVGYDQVTGLGSVDADRLVREWDLDFTSSINPTSLTVSAGNSATATVTVAETKFAANVTFTCSVASALANVTCAIPGTVPTGSGSATLTVTAASSAGTPWWRRSPQFPAGNRGWLYLLAALLLASSTWLTKKQKKLPAFAAAFALLLVLGLSSCGGGSSSETSTTTTTTNTTPAETGLITVVASAGTFTSTSTISVTVPAQ
jgi:subtilase family serine protease